LDHLEKKFNSEIKNLVPAGNFHEYKLADTIPIVGNITNIAKSVLNLIKGGMDSLEISTQKTIYDNSDCECNKHILVGYSNGGHQALKIAKKMESGYSPSKLDEIRTTKFALLFTIDPVKQFDFRPSNHAVGGYGFTKPANVEKAINFFQRVDEGSASGIKIYGDTVNGAVNTELHSTDFVKKGQVLDAHIQMPGLQNVQQSFNDAFDSINN
jgi:hypothetical protein